MAAHEGWADAWADVAIWGTIMIAIVVVAIIWGVVMVVRAVAGRKESDARRCKSCGVMVRPGNPTCPTCKATMDWS